MLPQQRVISSCNWCISLFNEAWQKGESWRSDMLEGLFSPFAEANIAQTNYRDAVIFRNVTCNFSRLSSWCVQTYDCEWEPTRPPKLLICVVHCQQETRPFFQASLLELPAPLSHGSMWSSHGFEVIFTLSFIAWEQRKKKKRRARKKETPARQQTAPKHHSSLTQILMMSLPPHEARHVLSYWTVIRRVITADQSQCKPSQNTSAVSAHNSST